MGCLTKTWISIFVLLLVDTGLFAQNQDPLRQPGETSIMSFELVNSSKYVSLCETNLEGSQGGGYLVYRFGVPGKVELQFPSDLSDSWKSFEYAYYLRGGGAANDGQDLNYLSFTTNGWKYTVYEEYRASDDSQRVGIRLLRLSDKKVFDLRGNPKTLKGSLISLRDDGRIPKGELPF